MDPLSITASVVGLLTFAGSALSKGYRVWHALSDSNQSIASLLTGLSQLTGVLVAINAQDGSLPGSSRFQSSGDGINASLASSIAECRKTIKAIMDILDKIEKCRTLVRATKLHLMKPEIEGLLQEIERHKQVFILCLGVDTRRRAEDIVALQHVISDQIQDVKSGTEKESQAAQEQRNQDKRRRLLAWLTPKGEERHERASRLVVPGTGDWVFQNLSFKNWLADSTQVMLISGIPGSGKSVLTSRIIDHLRQTPGVTQKQAAVAYFYCSFNESKKEETSHVVCSLAAQIMRGLPKVQDGPAMQYYQECDDGTRLPSQSRAQDLLVTLANELDTMYLVVDAIDEARDKVDLLDCLMCLLTRSKKIKLLVSCRSGDYDVEELLEGCLQVRIRPEMVRDDIARLVRHRVEHGPARLRSIDSDILVDKLTNKADGMFLWVSCQIDQLSRPNRSRNIEDALRRLPPGLFATYARILDNIDEDNKLLAARALRWLAHATIPLSLLELVEVVAVEQNSHSVKDLEKLGQPEDLLQICGSLVRSSDLDDKVHLAHFSVYEFLVSRQEQQLIPSIFRMQRDESLVDLCRSALTFLNFEEFSLSRMQVRVDPSPNPLTGQEAVNIESSFFDYAIRNWWRTLPLTAEGVNSVWPSIEAFFDKNTGNFASSVTLLRHLEGTYRYPVGMQPIHFCAMHGLPLLKQLSSSGSYDIEASVDDGRTALHIALENRNNNSVLDLVEMGAKIEACSTDGRTPVQYALESGDEGMFRFLVSKGAEIKVQFVNGDNPLSVAVSNGWHSLAKFVLDQSFDPDQRSADGRTCLHMAAQAGSDYDMFELLLKAEADQLLRDLNDWVPLTFASHHGHIEAVLCLMRDLEAPKRAAGEGLWSICKQVAWTPLHAAVEQEHLQVIELFSEVSYDISRYFAVERDEQTRAMAQREAEMARKRMLEARAMASYGSQSKPSPRGPEASPSGSSSLRLLQEPTKANGGKAPTPLWVATNQQYLAGIQALKKAGVCKEDVKLCVDLVVANGKITALKELIIGSSSAFRHLSKLVESGSVSDTYKKVLEELCDLQWDTKELPRLLYHLTAHDHQKLLEILLISNFVPATPDGKLANTEIEMLNDALLVALLTRNVEAAEILHSFGADLNCSVSTRLMLPKPATVSCSPIHVASELGDLKMVEFLLASQIDVNKFDTSGKRALHYAVHHDDGDIVRKLCAHGAQLEAQDMKGRTALHDACHYGRLQSAILLIQEGASLTAADNRGHTALHHWTSCTSQIESLLEILLDAKPGLLYYQFGPSLRTILHYAAEMESSSDVIRALIGHGADVEAEDIDGKTPVQVGTPAAARVLINLGACWREGVEL